MHRVQRSLRPFYVILAAGSASRMGFAKVFTALGNLSPLQRIASVLGEREALSVVPTAMLAAAREQAPATRIVPNDAPELGMAHSLQLALHEIERDRAVGVVLADMPFLSPTLLDALESLAAMSDADVIYPENDAGVPGHPVLFSSRARGVLERLPSGDTIRIARDEPSLIRRVLPFEHPGAYTDLDTPDDWERFVNDDRG